MHVFPSNEIIGLHACNLDLEWFVLRCTSAGARRCADQSPTGHRYDTDKTCRSQQVGGSKWHCRRAHFRQKTVCSLSFPALFEFLEYIRIGRRGDQRFRRWYSTVQQGGTNDLAYRINHIGCGGHVDCFAISAKSRTPFHSMLVA